MFSTNCQLSQFNTDGSKTPYPTSSNIYDLYDVFKDHIIPIYITASSLPTKIYALPHSLQLCLQYGCYHAASLNYSYCYCTHIVARDVLTDADTIIVFSIVF